MTVVITPVGTSLFTNGSVYNQTINDRFQNLKNKPESEWDNYSRYIEVLKTASEGFISQNITSASAELQSTELIQNHLRSDIIVHLLASDTIASRLAAEILMEQINNPNNVLGSNITATFNADPTSGQIDVIRDLQVTDPQDFSREGMPKLFHRINYIKDWEAGDRQNLAINITGGYGATLPYLTIFAQLERVPLYYNFEDSDELIVIPQAPLAIDWNLIKHHSNVLAQIDTGIEVDDWQDFKRDNYQAVEELDAFIWSDNDVGACLSPIGVIFWDQYLKNHFIVDLANNIRKDTTIEGVIQELYRRLRSVLSPKYLDPAKCYHKIRKLGPHDDLNHTGQVQGHDIFIFKSTAIAQIRLMYTFEVNSRTITQIKIYDKGTHMKTEGYNVWKKRMRCNHSTTCFNTHTFDIKP
ncbi:MAG: hypothetical protein OXN25_17275 [Candidatus Poribacteria bacterium]|nr:hypothetical protein [Candidatus Poribacteria bacterium]